jgi:hypothetical protein
MPFGLGKVYYQAKLGENAVTAEVVLDPASKCPAVLHDGVVYANPLVWINTAFQNSGKECALRIEKSPDVSTGTPRAKRYIPPKDRYQIGRYI